MVYFLVLSTMPRSVLWAVDVYGRVFHLFAERGLWERCEENQVELKRVTASATCCWSIGFDQQVYLNVLPGDEVIRHQEETYENQVHYTPCITSALFPAVQLCL